MSFICDGKWITDQINEVGQDVTIRVVSQDSLNKWGDATESFVDSTIKAIISMHTREDSDNKEGVFNAGDIVLATSKDNQALIVNGNRVIVDSEEFEINRVVFHRASGIVYLIEASLEKV